MRTIHENISTVFGIGKIPWAPGTFGSIAGLGVSFFLWHYIVDLFGSEGPFLEPTLNRLPYLIICNMLLIFLSYWSIKRTEQLWKTHDDKSIVIDEVAGQYLALCLFRPSIEIYTLGFVLFRVFDIYKPGPIGWADKSLKGPWGTLLDDLFAGTIVIPILWAYSIYSIYFS